MSFLRYLSMMALLAISSLPSLANDGSAGMAAGGIVFIKNDDIAMEREVLRISARKVNVDYVFRNLSDRAITQMVAFPMPDRPWYHSSETIGVLKHFQVMVDGISVQPRLEVKAFFKGRDVTAALRAAGLSDERIVSLIEVRGDNGAALTAIEGRRLQNLEKAGVIVIEPSGNPGFTDVFATVQYVLRKTYYWNQDFPPGKPVTISHQYTPAVWRYHFAFPENASADAFRASLRAKERDPYVNPYRDDGCIDNASIRYLRGKQPYTGGVYYVRYILKTARTWAGSIGEFELHLEKDNPNDLISLCFPGKPERVDAKTLVFRAKNFVPEKDLGVYFFMFGPS